MSFISGLVIYFLLVFFFSREIDIMKLHVNKNLL